MKIDRFEGDYAVIEISNKIFAKIDMKLLPDDAREGDEIFISTKNNEIKAEENQKRLDKLFVD